MKALRPLGLIAITLLLAALVAACGNATTQGSMPSSSNQNMNNNNSMNNGTPMTNGTPANNGNMNNGNMNNGTPTNNGNMNNGNMNNGTPTNNGNMMNGITITPSMTGNMGAFIHTGMAAINGKQVKVLITNKGFAVYYYRSDPMFQASCTGQCAHDWPPVLAPQGMMTVSSSILLPRHLSVHQTPNGAQVFYDGHALYTYAADMQPGNATGRGQDMQWYLVGFTL